MAFFNLWCPDNRMNRGDYSACRDEICSSLNNVISGTNRLIKELNYSHGYKIVKIKEISDPDDMVKGIHSLKKTGYNVIRELHTIVHTVKNEVDLLTLEKYEQCNAMLTENLDEVCSRMKPLLSLGSISFQEVEKIFTQYSISTLWAFLELGLAFLFGYTVFKLVWHILTRGSDVSLFSSVGIIALSCGIFFFLVLFIFVDRAVCRTAGRLENKKLLYFNETMSKLRSDLKRPFINLHYGMMAQAIRVRRRRFDFRDSDSDAVTDTTRLRKHVDFKDLDSEMGQETRLQEHVEFKDSNFEAGPERKL